MTYAKIILAIISLIQTLMRIGQENKWIKVGEDRAIAAGLAETLRRTEFADEALKVITALPDDDIDNLLHSLERPGEGEVDNKRQLLSDVQAARPETGRGKDRGGTSGA